MTWVRSSKINRDLKTGSGAQKLWHCASLTSPCTAETLTVSQCHGNVTKSLVLFITVKQNILLPSCDTTLSSTFKPVRDICFSLLFVRTLQMFALTSPDMRWECSHYPPSSTLYTVFGVYRLINIWGEAENEAWHGSSSVSQLLHSSMTGELRSVYDLYFYWAEFWLCFSLNSTFFSTVTLSHAIFLICSILGENNTQTTLYDAFAVTQLWPHLLSRCNVMYMTHQRCYVNNYVPCLCSCPVKFCQL